MRVPFTISNRLVKTHGILQVQVVPGSPNAITRVEEHRPLTDQELHWCQRTFNDPGLTAGTVLTLTPQTGKTHQLRRHLADCGMGLLGDPLYPRIQPADTSSNTLALWAQAISFTDPVTGQLRTFRAPAPWEQV